MSKISPLAVVDPNAKIGPDCEIGPFAVVGPDVVLGARCQIHAHAVVDGLTTLGDDCQVFESAHIGGKTQDLKFKEGNKCYVKVGNRTVLREFVTINCGTKDGESTVLGDDCLIMAYCHIAHGCVFGNHIIVSNSTQFAGEVHVEDWAVISGLCGFHQFVRVGCHAMVGAMTLATQDVPPYFITVGNAPKTFGVNKVGLSRRGFTPEAMAAIHQAYMILTRSGLNVSDSLKKIEAEVPQTDDVKHIVAFFRETQRGVILK